MMFKVNFKGHGVMMDSQTLTMPALVGRRQLLIIPSLLFSLHQSPELVGEYGWLYPVYYRSNQHGCPQH
jgi:hypothetical protein